MDLRNLKPWGEPSDLCSEKPPGRFRSTLTFENFPVQVICFEIIVFGDTDSPPQMLA